MELGVIWSLLLKSSKVQTSILTYIVELKKNIVVPIMDRIRTIRNSSFAHVVEMPLWMISNLPATHHHRRLFENSTEFISHRCRHLPHHDRFFPLTRTISQQKPNKSHNKKWTKLTRRTPTITSHFLCPLFLFKLATWQDFDFGLCWEKKREKRNWCNLFEVKFCFVLYILVEQRVLFKGGLVLLGFLFRILLHFLEPREIEKTKKKKK